MGDCDCGATIAEVLDMGKSAHAYWCCAVDGDPAAESMRREHGALVPWCEPGRVPSTGHDEEALRRLRCALLAAPALRAEREAEIELGAGKVSP